MKKIKLSRLAFAAAAMSVSYAAFAEDASNVFFGGAQYSRNSSYTYAGLLRPMADAKAGEGWYEKAVASWLTYRYATNLNGQDYEIRSSAPGVEGGVGYAWKGDTYTFDLSGTIGYRHARVTPIVPPNEVTGNVWTFNPQLQASLAFTPKVEASTIASYAFGQKSAYVRGRLAYKIDPAWFAGLQETYLKGPNYRINQHGLVVGRSLGNGYAAEISFGQSKPRNESSTGYVAVGLSRVF
jgi:Cellulose biosynthesis protein BcsS